MEVLFSVLLSIPLIGAYGIFALGIVSIYQASRVLNLAHGGVAMVSAYLYFSLTVAKVPTLVALVAGIAAGGILGFVIERFFVRPLRKISPTAQTVGTVAAYGLLIAVASKVWGTAGTRAPGIFPDGGMNVGRSTISFGQIGMVAVMLILSAALFAFLRFTDYGLAMRGTADNRRAAGLMGIDPDRASVAAWVLGGATAGLAGILLGAATSLHPIALSLQAVPAFVAVLIGGLESLPLALVGSVVVGVAQGLAPALPLTRDLEGGPQVILALVAFVVMASRGRTIVAGDVRSGVF